MSRSWTNSSPRIFDSCTETARSMTNAERSRALRVPRRVVIPRELSIRLLGETALLTGPVTLAVLLDGHEKIVRVFMSQVARFESGQWRFVWAQVTLSAE
jgi:hypothetical protein